MKSADPEHGEEAIDEHALAGRARAAADEAPIDRPSRHDDADGDQGDRVAAERRAALRGSR
jgi:hypothetical protein